jgi:hypothetical protein
MHSQIFQLTQLVFYCQYNFLDCKTLIFAKDKATVASSLSTTMTIGTNLTTPPPTLTIKHRKRVLFNHIFYRSSQNKPLPPEADSMAQKDGESLVHRCPCLCKEKEVHAVMHG